MTAKTSTSPILFSVVDKEEDHHWNRAERRLWFWTVFSGAIFLYATRGVAPAVAPYVAEEFGWSKTQSGSVLSAFFWGYALTQIAGGYWSDVFGAEKVLLISAVGWGCITFWFPIFLLRNKGRDFDVIIFFRILTGAFQGLFIPSIASLASQNLRSIDSWTFYGTAMSGTAFGTILTGTFGFFLVDSFGWPSMFYFIGFLSMVWCLVFKYRVLSAVRSKRVVIGLKSPLLTGAKSNDKSARVPWLVYLKSSALWACVILHFCQTFSYFIFISWLPTYFHDNFPTRSSWTYNVLPWAFAAIGTFSGSFVVRRLIDSGVAVESARKIAETICVVVGCGSIVFIGAFSPDFVTTLSLMCLCIWANGFHTSGGFANPQDLAPKHTGSIVGVMNTAGALPGFIGVYVAGYIVEVTKGNWGAVFNLSAAINICGYLIFCVYGKASALA